MHSVILDILDNNFCYDFESKIGLVIAGSNYYTIRWHVKFICTKQAKHFDFKKYIEN